ncbi:polysaccharide deacetylase [bacterium BMS3Abin03]|nr:polysaccharide deacetylase [bacterium BMS3Abin03]
MAVNSRNPKGINQGLVIIAGLIIIFASILVYLLVLRSVYGRYSVDELKPTVKSIEKFLLGSEPRVAILYSSFTKNMMPDQSTWVEDNIVTWKKFLKYQNQKYVILSDEDLETGKHFDYDLLVLPGAKSLSDREIIQIKKFLDRGGSIFATSGIASFSDDGKWRGWDFFSEVFGVKFSKEIGDDDFTKIHTLRGGLPITANVPAGYPLRVATWDKPIAVEVLDPRTTQVSFWYNYRLEEGLVREGIKESSGMIYGTYGKGRFVWMGFEINSVIGIHEDYVYFDRLFHNCIKWLMKEPIAFVKDWPSGYSAAAIISPSISDNAQNIRNLFPILTSEKIKATFFIQPDFAANHTDLVKYISKFGEISSLVDIGYLSSVNDTVNRLNNYDVQLKKLSDARQILEKITQKTVTGFLPYYGLFDDNTIRAAINAGYNYFLTDSLTDRTVPRTIIRGEDRILSITKSSRDDYEVIRDFGLTQNDFQYYTYQEDIDRVLFEGGLYVFKLHPEYQCTLDNIGVVKDVVENLRNKKFWITTANEIVDWYRKKDYLELRTEQQGNLRVAVTISNPGNEIVSNIVVKVDLNTKAKKINIKTEIIGTRIPAYSHEDYSNQLYLYVDDLKPNESRTYYIDYDQVQGQQIIF